MEYHDKEQLADMVRFYGLSKVLRELASVCIKEAAEAPERDQKLWQSANKSILSATLKIAVD